MTKTWDEVREEIWKLYGEGRSLEYIRKTLQRQRHFEASTRAFRLKLKAWKIKRSDITTAPNQDRQSSGEQSVLPTPARQSPSTSALALPVPEHLLFHDDAFSLSQLSRPTNQPTSQQDGAQHLGRSLEDLYLQISQVNFETSDCDLGRFLQPDDFIEGRTNILHFAVKEPSSEDNDELIENLLEYMQQHSIGLDMRDRQGRTALEIAIQRDSCSLARLLILNGASAKQLDESARYSTLHMALVTGASPSLFRLLLDSGADPDFCLPTSEAYRTPLSWVADTLRSLCKGKNGGYLKWFEIAGSLLKHGANWSLHEAKDILGSFLYYFSMSSGSGQLFDVAKPLLETYLDAGHSPLDVECLEADNSLHCNNITLVHAAVNHSTSPDLGLLITRLCAKHYLSSIIREILRPRLCIVRDAPLANMGTVLSSALRSHEAIDSYSDTLNKIDLLILALQYTPHQFVVQYAQAIASVMHNGVAVCDHKIQRHFVHLLVSRSPDVRYALAEIILEWQSYTWQCFSPVIISPKLIPSLGFQDMMKEIRYLPLNRDLVQEIDFRIRILSQRGFCAEEDVPRFVDCVLHVVTKESVDATFPSDALAKEKLLEVIQMRRLHRLPDLHIPQQLLYRCFCDQD